MGTENSTIDSNANSSLIVVTSDYWPFFLHCLCSHVGTQIYVTFLSSPVGTTETVYIYITTILFSIGKMEVGIHCMFFMSRGWREMAKIH